MRTGYYFGYKNESENRGKRFFPQCCSIEALPSKKATMGAYCCCPDSSWPHTRHILHSTCARPCSELAKRMIFSLYRACSPVISAIPAVQHVPLTLSLLMHILVHTVPSFSDLDSSGTVAHPHRFPIAVLE